MATFSYKIDLASIKAKMSVAMAKSPTVRRKAFDLANSYFQRVKNTMLKQFNEHTITQEIESGKNAVNLSNTLDGYGNLFSFIGFPSEERPIAELRELLSQNTTIRQSIYRNRVWYFKVSVPDRADIESHSQMPWEPGNSWAYEVERGISGASHYMYKKWLAGRSQQGLEIPFENMEDLTFTPKPYISQILSSFRDKINNIS